MSHRKATHNPTWQRDVHVLVIIWVSSCSFWIIGGTADGLQAQVVSVCGGVILRGSWWGEMDVAS